NVDTFQDLQVYGFHSLMALIQGLNTVLGNSPVRILTIANGLHTVRPQETIIPEKSTLLGATRVIPQENLGVTCRTIDIVLPEGAITQTTPLIEQLFQESLATEVNEPLLAFRDAERLVQTYEPMTVAEAPSTMIPFRQGGVYLITGGMGAVGPILAEHIGTTYKATIILMSRSEMLPHEQWQNWIDTHDEQDDTSLKLKHLIAMEEGGGRLVFMQGDIGDVTQVRLIVQQIHERFGALHGILHAAGVTNALSFKSTQEITPADFEMQVRPKVQGLYALEDVLQDYTPDFCLLFSSISVILGGITFSAYVAGNVFLDAFVQTRQQNVKFPWLSINWDTWEVKENMHGAIGATVAEYSMRPEEACEVLTRVLAHRIPHIVISTGDLQTRIKQWIELESLLAADDDDANDGQKRGSAVPLSLKDYEKTIAGIWQQVLGLPEVGLYENFFDLGGNSLIGLQVISKMKKAFNLPIPAVALYEAPTISALARYLLPIGDEGDAEEQIDHLKERRDQARQSSQQEEIAIIGMNGRFPGAPNVDVFWENLRNGVESVSFFTEEELIEAGCDPQQVRDPAYVRARPILPAEDIEKFDALFFGYSPREAELTDPQHRLFLETAWEALELAGYNPAGYDGLIGVFGGSNISTYMMSMLNNPEAVLGDDYQMVIGNDKDSLTTSVSYKMNLKGPSYAVQPFCSTSLVAVHLACQSLLHGESDIAMAGGVSIRVPVKAGHLYEEGGMESPDGHCRTFDSQAKGSMFGDGVGIVVLKRLSEAVADGDIIHAVIKGSAVNNDGSLKVSYTAPSVVGQSSVVTLALEAAGVSPESISYIEAHGTATELGDPIEVASLTKAYRAQTDQTGYCAIGSVKTNVGHLDRAAGVSGLIKTVLALKHREIPASLHFQEPNPEIDFENSPFYVNTELSPWETNNGPNRAGINSLGLGGTNAHVIVEEAPEREPSGPSRPWQFLTLSARTASALAQSTQRLHDHLLAHPEVPLADVAYTLQVGRKLMDHRRVIVCRNSDEALQALNAPTASQSVVLTGMEMRTDQQVAFLFPGVGERYIDIAKALYHAEEVFQTSIDSCHVFLQKEYDLDLHSILQLNQDTEQNNKAETTSNGKVDLQSLLGRKGNVKGAEPTRTALAQPAVFVVEYALAQLFLKWGLRPQAMLGYSLGEYVAACVAGVLSLKDALRMVASRAQLIDEVKAGAMLAVMLPEDEIKPYLNEQVNLAIQNSLTACVLAGPISSIEQVEKRLLADDIACRRVEATHAFHSQMLSPLTEKVTELAQSVKLHVPQIPYLSNVTGTWITDEQATDPAYWAQHMCQTVRFADGVGELLEKTDCLLLEVGPGQALSFFAKQHPASAGTRRDQILPTLPAPHGQQKQDPHAFLLTTLSKLWLSGVSLDWKGYYASEKRQRVILPTYPFERQRYWIEGGSSSARAIASTTQDQKQVLAPAEILAGLKKEEISDWFYLPGWKHAAPQLLPTFEEDSANRHWLLFQDELGIADQLHEQLLARGQSVVSVKTGTAFARHSDTSFTVRPAERTDYSLLLLALQELQKVPQRIVHFWSVTPSLADLTPEVRLANVLESSFYSLMALAQALGEVDLEEACQIVAVSNDLQDVTGSETICPEKAVVIGPSRVIAQEYPTLSCRSVDIAIPANEKQRRTLISHLLGEVLTPTREPVVALRRTGRWLLTFEPAHIPAQPLEETPLREGGTYLITGGLGGIGLAMATYLARTLKANLVLTSRNGLPAREQWEQIIQEKGSEKGVGRQIGQVLALEALGSSVLPVAADVSNMSQMDTAVQQTIEAYGILHGVIHAAGLPAVGLMQNKTAEQAASVMAPKLEGTLAMEYALRNCDLDFLVFFSSITSSTGGGPGQIDYCAGNAYMDAYALQQINSSRRTVAINWGEWQWNAWDSGLSGYDEETQAFFRANRQAFGISFEEGAEALQRILAQPFPEVIVSTQNFGVISQLSRTHTAATALEQFQKARGNQQRHERPPMRNEYTAPQSDMERTIAEVWENILGIDGIGSKDNFFDLGGNSLVGIELITQIRKALHMQTLPSYVLYEAPTVEAMAAFLNREETPVQEQQENRQERSDKRRENLKLRMRERVVR
ncbi:MAG: SDR family NAD(P)-dependent oxidoreductase, partial [Ktedonobacteraceae bacterium]|nr:SDR family NAD(P)-dependent oxidoreductase [Ktedonobacteraceae bacterium]